MPLIENPLSKFATYNALWTLSCPPAKDLVDASYRTKPQANVIFSSAGRFDATRVQTAFGAPEYFIDNVEMEVILNASPMNGNVNIHSIKFEIFEPYSLGLFYQSLQMAAFDSGYKCYDGLAPYLLKLEFKGQSSTSKFETVGPYFFLLQLRSSKLTVNETGSQYRVEAVPFNQILFNATVNTAWNECHLTGKTAREVLIGETPNSLISQLNIREQDLVKNQKKKYPDIYSIEFVPCDWGGPNPFDPGDLEFNPQSVGGLDVFKKYDTSTGEDGKVVREKVTIDATKQTFLFSQGTSLTNIIDAVLLTTKTARDNVTNDQKIQKDGCIIFWKVTSNINILTDKYNEATKEYAKEVKYRIVPYRIHHTIHPGPEATAKGVNEIKKNLVKRYEYIYTGKNEEVLRFDINLDYWFHTAVNANKAEDNTVQVNPGPNASGYPDAQAAKPASGQTKPAPENTAPAIKPNLVVGALPFKGGSGRVDAKQVLANEFYMSALTKQSSDMTALDLEIMGDPYWLPENAIGNYHPIGDGSQVAGNTMNYEAVDLFIEVNFRTPIDARGADGLMYFQDGNQKSPFSGLYKVTTVKHRFSGGQYKTTLIGVRMMAQNIEGESGSVYPSSLDIQTRGQTQVFKIPGIF